eukprot:403434_1
MADDTYRPGVGVVALLEIVPTAVTTYQVYIMHTERGKTLKIPDGLQRLRYATWCLNTLFILIAIPAIGSDYYLDSMIKGTVFCIGFYLLFQIAENLVVLFWTMRGVSPPKWIRRACVAQKAVLISLEMAYRIWKMSTR